MAVFLPWVHSSLHSLLIVWWIAFAFADLSVVCHGPLLMRSVCVAAFFAALSAFSLPSIPTWPGTHSKHSVYAGLVRCSSSISSRIRLMIDCPDWHRGLSIDLIAGWLSVKIRHLIVSVVSFLTWVIAMWIASSSPAYTIDSVSFPRWRRFVCWVVWQYIAAPIP